MGDSSKNTLCEYLTAIQNNNYDDAIKVLTTSIENIPSDNKDQLIIFFIHRIKCFFKIKNYQEVLNDCLNLTTLGYNLNNHADILIIQTESKFRIARQQAVDAFQSISLKFNLNIMSEISYLIDMIDLETIFEKNADRFIN